MKPKLSIQMTPGERPNPGTGLRINQAANRDQGSTYRVGRPTERKADQKQRSKSCSGDQLRRSPTESVASVKERIETYLTTAATVGDSAEKLDAVTNMKPKSILVQGGRKKGPKLVHSSSISGGSKLKIYAQSATEEETTDAEDCRRNKVVQNAFLQVPRRNNDPGASFPGGVMKSKSFATARQFECALDERAATKRKRPC